MEADGSTGAGQRAEELLTLPLRQNEALEMGSLENGLRYVLLPNRSPPSRFEAHLEVHAGSGACMVSLHGQCASVWAGAPRRPALLPLPLLQTLLLPLVRMLMPMLLWEQVWRWGRCGPGRFLHGIICSRLRPAAFLAASPDCCSHCHLATSPLCSG